MARLNLRAPIKLRIVVTFALVLFWASAAHAQRIPDEFIWFAGASLFAPVVAVPIKLGILRLLHLEAGWSRLWAISAIEWLLWFPAAFILLRSGRSSSAPLTVLTLFGLVVWLHRVRVANTSWSSALYMALPTPILAIALPFLAFVLHAFLDRLAA